MSTLKVNKLRDTAGSAAAITLDPNGGAVLAGVTTMTTARVTSGIVTNTFIVGAGVTISESGIEASGIGISCANLNGGAFSNRNMVINGAMEVDQRNEGSAVTSSPGGSLNFAADRNHFYNYGTGELTATLQRVADAWKTYRQALRDLPASASPSLDSNGELDLTSVTWPTEPS